jgi:hypothetical protein
MASPVINDQEQASKLCVDCGLCCSGAIFDHADLAEGEADFVRSIGMDIIAFEKPAAVEVIKLPCPHLCGTACTIHQQPRPKICGAFFCQLAINMDRGVFTLEGAQAKVRNAQDLLTQLEPHRQAGESWVDLRIRWKATPSRKPPEQPGKRPVAPADVQPQPAAGPSLP